MLNVTLYGDADSIASNEGLHLEVDYVSLFNNESYGPPALIAPAPNGRDGKRAAPGERVLYINTNLVPSFSVCEED